MLGLGEHDIKGVLNHIFTMENNFLRLSVSFSDVEVFLKGSACKENHLLLRLQITLLFPSRIQAKMQLTELLPLKVYMFS